MSETYDSVMLDLETMGNGSYAAIVTIGAVWFNLNEQDTFDEIADNRKFYAHVNLQSSLDAGLKVDGSTIVWWLGQSESARRELTDIPGGDLKHVLDMFSLRLHPDHILWGNGATFDNVILRNAFKSCGLTFPLSHSKDRCYRTLNKLFPLPFENYGTHHNALDDAISQAIHLQKIFKILPERKTNEPTH